MHFALTKLLPIVLTLYACQPARYTPSSKSYGFVGVIDDLVPIPKPKNIAILHTLQQSIAKRAFENTASRFNLRENFQKILLEKILEIDGIPRTQLKPIIEDLLSSSKSSCGGASCERVFGVSYLEIDQFLDETYALVRDKGNLVSNRQSYETLIGSLKKSSDKRVLPLGGYEPPYEPDFWNKSFETQNTANCYAYAVLQVCSKYPFCKIQPGEISRASRDKPFLRKVVNAIEKAYGDDLNANFIISQVKKDLGKGRIIYKTTADATPPKGFRKVALVVAPNEDYHWYMQNAEGFWSHKPGVTEVTNKDASGEIIWNPEKSDRNYKNFVNYREFSGYFMVD